VALRCWQQARPIATLTALGRVLVEQTYRIAD
jgi:hypothetical protein